MRIVPFVAENTAAALAQIHEQLGPDAVVLSLRRLPARGVEWLWNRQGHVEVLAAVMDSQEQAAAAPALPGTGRDSWDDSVATAEAGQGAWRSRSWRSLNWLESLGLLPEYADQVEARLRTSHGPQPPASALAEWAAVRDTLAGFWRPPPAAQIQPGRPHVFIGPPGSGKTTVLCKWLTLVVLNEERTARVWQLDSVQANTAGLLPIHCEMLGVPLGRVWDQTAPATDACFVDLPGVEPGDAAGLSALRQQLAGLPSPCVHLVLNAAYETPVLFHQFHAFASFQPADLIFTHLDEEQRRVKLWNFVLGTNCPLSFLSGGQRIPGDFWRAESALLFPHQKRP